MRSMLLMAKWGLIALVAVCVLYLLLVVVGNLAFADETQSVREAQLGEQNRAVNDYSAREASELANRMHESMDEDGRYPASYYRYKGLGDEAGVKLCTHTDISVAAVLWELMNHPELIPVVELALQEYYNDHPKEHNRHTTVEPEEGDDHEADAGGDDSYPPT